MNIIDKNKKFYCYNPKLRKFLSINGLRWDSKGFNSKSNSYYWTFTRSEQLDQLLKEYRR